MNSMNAVQKVKEQRRVILAAVSMCSEQMLINGIFESLCVTGLKDIVSLQ